MEIRGRKELSVERRRGLPVEGRDSHRGEARRDVQALGGQSGPELGGPGG